MLIWEGNDVIVGELKPLAEIAQKLERYSSVYIVGCGGCVTVCQSGGERAVRELTLLMNQRYPDKQWGWTVLPRQCENEFVDSLQEEAPGWQALLSLACGVGVQALAGRFPQLPVLPGLNTRFMGLPVAPGVFEERCLGCGNCLLDLTGGICPVARCAKSLLNGPCGGSQGGKCEIGGGRDCAWQLIHDRLQARGELALLDELWLPRDWSTSHHGGPRRMIREDLMTDGEE